MATATKKAAKKKVAKKSPAKKKIQLQDLPGQRGAEYNYPAAVKKAQDSKE